MIEAAEEITESQFDQIAPIVGAAMALIRLREDLETLTDILGSVHGSRASDGLRSRLTGDMDESLAEIAEALTAARAVLAKL